MLFWIFVILLVVGIILFILNEHWLFSDLVESLGLNAIVAGIFGLMVTGLILIFNHAGKNGEIAYWETKREMLVYQLENNIYENDNDLGKRDLMEDIVEYNTSLARKQANQDDFWIGIFVPDIYDQFEFIELE